MYTAIQKIYRCVDFHISLQIKRGCLCWRSEVFKDFIVYHRDSLDLGVTSYLFMGSTI